MTSVEISVLGPLEVRVGGEPVDVPGRRPSTLLAMLALAAGRWVVIDELAAALWGAELPERVKGSLQTYVGRLRRIVGAKVIVTGPVGYRLDPDLVDVDLDRFVALTGRAAGDGADDAGQLLDQALELWRGDPLSGLSDWIDRHERPAVVERYLAAVERRADLWLADGDHRTAIMRLRPLVQGNPLRESLWQRLIVGLRAAGRPAEALEAYASMRAVLADELGTDPSPALQALYRDMLDATAAGDGGTAAGGGAGQIHRTRAVPHQVPWVARRFVGRSAELARLDELTGPPEHEAGDHDPGDHYPGDHGGVVAIHGPGGSGKTTLAVRWASRAAARFPDGELFVGLNGYGPGEPVSAADALASLLRGVGVDNAELPPDVEGRAAALRTAMADRRMIVVLDDAADSEQVRPLLPGGPSVVVITSRDQLRGLAAREGASRLALGPTTEADSVALLTSRLAGAPTSDVDQAELSALATLCGHLPVAMVIAAERAARGDVRLGALIDLLRERNSRLDVLTTGDDVTTDVRAVFDWSYRALPGDVAALYRMLGGVVDTGFSVPVAAALVGGSAVDVERRLDRLVASTLVTVSEPGWFALHDLIREHAHDVAVTHDPHELATAKQRLRQWYVHSAYGAERVGTEPTLVEPGPCPSDVDPQRFTDQRSSIAWFDRHRRAIATVLAEAAANSEHDLLYRLAAPTAWYHDRVGAFSESALLTEIALNSARAAGDDIAVAVFLNRRGTGLGRQGRLEEAREAFVEARELFARGGSPIGEYRVVCNLGQVHVSLGEADQAIALLEDARTATASFDEIEHLPVVSLLAQAYREAGRWDESVALGHLLVERWRALGHPEGEAMAYDHLGAIAVLQGRLDEAEAAYRTAADVYESIGNLYDMAWSLAEIGEAQADAGMRASAETNLNAALDLLDRIGASDSQELNRAAIEATLAGLRSEGTAATT